MGTMLATMVRLSGFFGTRRDVKRAAWAMGNVDTWDALSLVCKHLTPAERVEVACDLLSAQAELELSALRSAEAYDVPADRRALYCRVHVVSARAFLARLPGVAGTPQDPFSREDEPHRHPVTLTDEDVAAAAREVDEPPVLEGS